jgi:hypothetical protein
MTMLVEKQKRKQETVDEECMDAFTQWIDLDRKPTKEDDWLRYATKPRRKG